MKTSVAITLIISGTVLILAPYISTAIGTAQVAHTMSELSKPVNIKATMPEFYDTACMITGIIMILLGSISALKSKGK